MHSKTVPANFSIITRFVDLEQSSGEPVLWTFLEDLAVFPL